MSRPASVIAWRLFLITSGLSTGIFITGRGIAAGRHVDEDHARVEGTRVNDLASLAGPARPFQANSLGIAPDREQDFFLRLKLAVDPLKPGDSHLVRLQGVELGLGPRQNGFPIPVRVADCSAVALDERVPSSSGCRCARIERGLARTSATLPAGDSLLSAFHCEPVPVDACRPGGAKARATPGSGSGRPSETRIVFSSAACRTLRSDALASAPTRGRRRAFHRRRSGRPFDPSRLDPSAWQDRAARA